MKQKLLPTDIRGVLKEKSLKEFYITDLNHGIHVLVKKDMDGRLRENDYVTGSAILMNDEGDYVLDAIKTINFRTDKLYADNLYRSEKVSPNEKFAFGEQEIFLGGRYVLKNTKFLDEKNLAKLLQEFNQKNIVTLALISNVLDEDAEQLRRLGFNATFLLKYDARPLAAYETIMSFVDCVARLQSQGLRLALFVEDVVTLANIVDFAFKNSPKAFMGHTEMAVETIKKIMLLSGAEKSGASTTLFVTQDDADMFDQMYVSSVYKISKKASF